MHPQDRRRPDPVAQIVAAGHELFARHGFEAVTLAAIAALAGRSTRTVTGHFPSKELLFFGGRTPVEEGLLAAVAGRAVGESVYEAVRRCVTPGRAATAAEAVRGRAPGESTFEALARFGARAPGAGSGGADAGPGAGPPGADPAAGPPAPHPEAARVFRSSPALQTWVRERYADLEARLAAQLAADARAAQDGPGPAGADHHTGADHPGPAAVADLRPAVVAAALVAPLRWRCLARLAGAPVPPLEPAYDLLAPALRDHARRPAGHQPTASPSARGSEPAT